MQDVRTHVGTLLVARGFEVSSTFLERIQNFGPDLLGERVKVDPCGKGCGDVNPALLLTPPHGLRSDCRMGES